MNASRIASAIAIAVVAASVIGCSKGDQVSARLERAANLLSEKKTERARAEIDAAIKLDPSRTSTYRAAISLYGARKLAADKARTAEMMLQAAKRSKLKPKPPSKEIMVLHRMLAQTYWDERNLAKAESEFKAALALGPYNAQILNDFGFFYAQEGIKLDEAVKMTRRAMEFSPYDGYIIDSHGWALHKRGDHAAAIKTLKRAVELEPDSADLRYHLGAAYAGAGMKTEAEIELRKALTRNPKLSEATQVLANLHK
jgi:Tfp pilus assembly protein PilF